MKFFSNLRRLCTVPTAELAVILLCHPQAYGYPVIYDGGLRRDLPDAGDTTDTGSAVCHPNQGRP